MEAWIVGIIKLLSAGIIMWCVINYDKIYARYKENQRKAIMKAMNWDEDYEKKIQRMMKV